MSDLGLISYRAYWKDILLYYLCNYPEKEISVKAISEEMGKFANILIQNVNKKFKSTNKSKHNKTFQGFKHTT